MIDNEESIAKLLYTIWSGEKDPLWDSLPPNDLARWQRLTRFMLSREVSLTLKCSNERYYEEHTKRLVSRIDRWQKESELFRSAVSTVPP